MTLSVESCTGGKSLITLVVRTDYWPHEASYQLHAGRGVSSEVVQSSDALAVPNGLNYADWCLPHALYTAELKDAKKDGWANPAGWWLTVDLGAMLFKMGQMPAGAGVATSFSSLLPFQVGFGEWRLFNSESVVSEDWRAVEFDDAEWQSVKGGAMGNHVGTTAYIRREVTVPSLEDYSVLNVRMKYAGGVAVYFNGRLVARFNLEESFVADSEALAVHDASLFSKFHVILSTVGAVAGKNVIAFEVHRSADQSTIAFRCDGRVRRERLLGGAGHLLLHRRQPCKWLHEGGPAGFEPVDLRLPLQHRGLLHRVDGGEPGGLQVEQLRAAEQRRAPQLRLLAVRPLRARTRSSRARWR